ncbi:MAG: hypothetical protein KIT10_07385 [Flavobacteriales bacterium]|nr:hypothetical protein [Flavobacteriales bacterium]
MYFSDSQSPVNIAIWEYFVLFLMLAAVGLWHAREKNANIKRYPEYRYYLWGLYIKMIGAALFSLTYVYYYANGDTISYFLSSVPLAKLFWEDPILYAQALVMENSVENRSALFTLRTGYPMSYIYFDSRSYLLVRLISPFTIITFQSYLLCAVAVSVLAYGGVWRLYRTLVRYYPKLQWQLAVAVLFLPSSVFWGSGILKDTFTFTALCWYVYALDRVFMLRQGGFTSWVNMVVASIILLGLKPYIFMTIFPASLLWVLYQRVANIRNALVRVMFLPVAMVLLVVGTIITLESLGDRLSKFSLDKALDTVVLNQKDMKRSEHYGENFFDLGDIEPTWESVLSKFPQATFAGLFRPMIVESNNVVMFLAGLENTFLLLLALYILYRSRLVFFFTLLLRNPLLQMCYFFAVGYAFMIAITTPNFGAMVRFKIPLLPFFVAAMFITAHILDRRRAALAGGGRFDFESFVDGDPDRKTGRPMARKEHPGGRGARGMRGPILAAQGAMR